MPPKKTGPPLGPGKGKGQDPGSWVKTHKPQAAAIGLVAAAGALYLMRRGSSGSSAGAGTSSTPASTAGYADNSGTYDSLESQIANLQNQVAASSATPGPAGAPGPRGKTGRPGRRGPAGKSDNDKKRRKARHGNRPVHHRKAHEPRPRRKPNHQPIMGNERKTVPPASIHRLPNGRTPVSGGHDVATQPRRPVMPKRGAPQPIRSGVLRKPRAR